MHNPMNYNVFTVGMAGLACMISPFLVAQTPIAPMWESRQAHALVHHPAIGVLAIGGFDGGITLSSTEAYDTESDAWSPRASMPSPRQDHTAHATPDGVAVIGGWDGNSDYPTELMLYSADVDAWMPGPALPGGRAGHASCVLADGRILITGGYDGTADQATTFFYQPTDGSLTPGPDLNTARSSHALVPLPDGGAAAIGGFNPAEGFQLASCERLDPVSNTWLPMAPLPTGVDNLAAVPVSGGIAMLGGRVYNPASNAFEGLASGAWYDAASDAWWSFALAAGHSYHHAFVHANAWFTTLVVTGGADATGIGVETTYSDAERLDLTPTEVQFATTFPDFPGRFRAATTTWWQGGQWGMVSGGDADGAGSAWIIDLTPVGSVDGPTPTAPLLAFPNPAIDRVIVPALAPHTSWTARDGAGKAIAEGRGPVVEVGGWPTGLYTLHPESGGCARILVGSPGRP